MNDAQVKFKVIMDDKDASSAVDNLASKSSKLDKEIGNATNKFSEFGDKSKQLAGKFVKAGAIMTAGLTVPLVTLGSKAFSMAAEFNDAIGATDQIFKGSSNAMQFWAKNLETYYGVAEGEALTYANTMGAMLQNIGGLSEKKAAQQSQLLVELAGDLSAMFGGTTESAVQALTGALKGNNTMLDNYGMAVNDVMIKSKALEMGLIKEGTEMTLAAKQAATLALIMEQAGAATGQAERESSGASGTLKTLQTEVANLTKTLGEELLPIFVPMIQKIVEWVKEFSSLDDKTKKMIVTAGLFLAAVGPVVTFIGGFISVIVTLVGWIGGAISAVTSFATFIGGLMTPIGWVIAAIAAVIAIGVLLWKNWDTVKEKAGELWSWITDKFEDMANFIENIDWKQIGKDMMNAIWDGLKDIWNSLWNWVSDIGKKISDAILGKQKDINDFNNQSSGYTGMSVNSVSTSGKAGLVPKIGATQTSSNTSNTVIQNFYSQTVSSTDAYRKKVELSNAY